MPLSIESLPNEILNHVLLYMPQNNLHSFTLAFTCKRFYAAFLPMLMGVYAQQLQEATNLTIFQRIAAGEYFRPVVQEQYPKLFSSRLDDLQIRYIVTASFQTAPIWCLCALLARIARLDRLILQIDQEAEGYFAGREPDLSRELWFRAVAALLRVCISHDGAQIELRGLPWSGYQYTKYSPFSHEIEHATPILTTPTPSHQPAIAPPPTTFVHRILSGWLTDRRSPPVQNTIPSAVVVDNSSPSTFMMSTLVSKPVVPADPLPTLPVNAESRLSRIVLSGASTFIPPMYFLFEKYLLNPSQPTLTSLTVSGSKCSQYDWHAILQLPSWQRFSRLEHLDIGDSQIPFPDLLDFLQRHPTITELELSRYRVIGKLEFPDSGKGILPNLKNLRATPEILIPLFDKSPEFKPKSTVIPRSSSSSSSLKISIPHTFWKTSVKPELLPSLENLIISLGHTGSISRILSLIAARKSMTALPNLSSVWIDQALGGRHEIVEQEWLHTVSSAKNPISTLTFCHPNAVRGERGEKYHISRGRFSSNSRGSKTPATWD